MATTPDSKQRMAIRRKILTKVEEQKEMEKQLMIDQETKNEIAAKTICGRCKKNKLECNCGHPLLLEEDPIKLGLLKEAFKLGCSDRDACIFAEISESALRNYVKNHPEFEIEKEKLKILPLMKAKSNVIRAVSEGNLNPSYWYLERKQRAEFGVKQEVELSGHITHGVVVVPAKVSLERKDYVEATEVREEGT